MAPHWRPGREPAFQIFTKGWVLIAVAAGALIGAACWLVGGFA